MRRRLFPLVALALVAAVFAPAMWAPFLADDYPVIAYLARADLADLLRDGLWDVAGGAGRYRPVLHLSAKLDWWIWGLEPFGYHLTNLLLHTGSGILLWSILRRLANDFVATAAALLWVVDPLHVEPVCWLSARGNLLAVFFLLVTARLQVAARPTPGRRLAAWVAALAALLSHETVIGLPALLALVDFVRRPPPGRLAGALRCFAFFASALAACLVLRVLVLDEPFGGELTAIVAKVPAGEWPSLVVAALRERAALLLAPVHPSFGAAPRQVLLGGAGLVLAAGLWARRRRLLPALAALGPVFLVAVLLWAPAAFVVIRTDTYQNTRTLYALALPAAVLVAVAISVQTRVLRLGLAAVPLVAWAVLCLGVARLWREAADEAAEWAQAARGAAADPGVEKVWLFEPPLMRDGFLILENAGGALLEPPFFARGLPCHVLTRGMLTGLAMLREKDELRGQNAPILGRRAGRLVVRRLAPRRLLSARTFTGPELRGARLTTLDVAALRTSAGSAALVLEWTAAGGSEGEVPAWPLRPDLGGGVLFPVGSDPDWLLAGTVVSLRIRGGDPGRVTIDDRLPELSVGGPPDGLEIRRGAPPPRFRAGLRGFGTGGRLLFLTWPGALPFPVPVDGPGVDYRPAAGIDASGRFAWSVFEERVLFAPELATLYWCVEEYDLLGRAVARSALRRLVPKRP